MKAWRDEAVLLQVRPLGETSVILDVFTPMQGRHAGVLRGGTSRKMAPSLQVGAQLDVSWTARLEQHLGTVAVEPVRSRSALAMGDRLALTGLRAVCALLLQVLPEREPHAPLYDRTQMLLDLLGQSEIWPLAYLQWEIALLEELGFALDLGRCAVTGQVDDLVYVSPKSGRAVSRGAAGEWADRLLDLPDILKGEGDASDRDVAAALRTTGFFIEHRLLQGTVVTPTRQLLIDLLAR